MSEGVDPDLLCENCGLKPIVHLVQLEDEPVGLCAECLADIAGVIEEENDY